MEITTIGICILAFIALCILNCVVNLESIAESSDTIKDIIINSIFVTFIEILIGICLIFLVWFFENYIWEWLP